MLCVCVCVCVSLVCVCARVCLPCVLCCMCVPSAGWRIDPVTGSAHSVLAPYWAKVLNVDTMFARQCSARGGDLTCTISTSKGEPTVLISGQAIVVMSGRINLPCSMLSSP